MRDTERGETARLDVVQPGAFGTGEASPEFQGANAAGTVAFFTDKQNLTEDANESGADLYRCAVTVEGGELGCDLTDLSANPGGESAEVRGLVPGMSEDASRVYFVAYGVLDHEANSQGESAAPGQPNLYLWRQGAGVRFIATLARDNMTGRLGFPTTPATRAPTPPPRAATSPSCRSAASPATTTATR